MELSMVLEHATIALLPSLGGAGGGFTHPGHGICCNFIQSYAADGAHRGAEVALQQPLAQSDALKYLRAAIAADGRDTHLGHDFEESFLHRLDVVSLCRGIVLLYLSTLHEVVQYGKDHVRAQRTGAISQQQCGVHRLAYLAALHYQRCLHALADAYQVVVHRRDSQQRRYDTAPRASEGGVCLAHFLFPVGQDDVVITVIYRLFRILAQLVQCRAQTLPSLGGAGGSERDRQLDGVKTFISDVAQYVELRVVQHRMRQANHLAVSLVGVQDAVTHASDILRQRHHKVLADGVDGGVGDLRKLLTEIVEEHLRPC